MNLYLLGKKIKAVIFGLLVLSLTVQAENLPENVVIHQLDNGLQVLLIQNPAMPMVGVNVVVKVGSAFETFSTSGMSHMLEHLLFNGTTTRSQKELYDDTDRIGGYNNANTSRYFTNFMMVTPAEHIKNGMEIQADMLFRSTLPEAKFQKEKGIVLEEISKSLADAREQAERNAISLLYPGHALSLPTLGTYATIEAMDRDQVFEFYKNNYVPNNMLMSVIGNFEMADMLKIVTEIYGSESPGEVYRGQSASWAVGFEKSEFQQGSTSNINHRFYDGEDEQLQFFYPIQANASTAFYNLLEKQLKEVSSDLEALLKEADNESVSSASTELRLSPIRAFIVVRVNIKDAVNTTEMQKKIKQTLQNHDWKFSDQKLQSEIAGKRTDFLKNIEKPHMFGIFNAQEFAINGIEGVLASYSAQTYQDAAADLEGFKVQSDPLILFQHPTKKEQSEATSEVAPAKVLPLGDGHPTVIAKQNKASDLLAVHYIIQHKAPLENQYGKDAAKILHDIFGERLKSDQNVKSSQGFGLSIKVNDNPFFPMDDRYMHPDYGYIRVESLADDVPAVIAFFNNQMLNFVPSEAEFNKALAKLNRPNPMMMRGGSDKAKKIFDKAYKSLIYEENPYPAVKNFPTYEQIQDFAKSYFIPVNMIISVISPGATEEIEEMFADFKSDNPAPAKPVYDQQIRIHHKAQQVEKEGAGNRSYLFYGFSKEIDAKDHAALQALSLILSEKIVFDIREKQGMAYHMSAGISFSKNRALFYINQGTRPENVDKLVPQYSGFFSGKMLDGLNEEDLQKSLNMYLGRMMFRRLSSINQGYYLGHSYYFHQDIQYDHNFLEALKQVRLEDVKRVAQKYMQIENEVTVIVR